MSCGKILIIEPEPNARTALRELLVDEGYEVLTAPNMADVDAMRAFAPHAALVDASQLELDASARALARIAPVSIVMSLRDPPRGEAPYLQKPIDISELFVAVACAVEHARRRASLIAGETD